MWNIHAAATYTGRTRRKSTTSGNESSNNRMQAAKISGSGR